MSRIDPGQHHETLIEEAPELPSERSTGIVFAVVSVIAAVFLRHHTLAMTTAGAVALGFLALALLAPAALGPLNRAWFRLALLLNRAVSPVIMLAIYGLVIVPAGLLMQALRDPLQLKPRAGSGTTTGIGTGTHSYWIARTPASAPTSMRDQF